MLGDNVMDEKEIKKIVNKNIKTFFIKQIVFTCIKEILLLFALYEVISFIWVSFEMIAYPIHNSEASTLIISVLFFLAYSYIYNPRTIKRLIHAKDERQRGNR